MAITFVAAGTSSATDAGTLTPGLPAGLAAGDVMVFFAFCRDAVDATAATPSGWTEIVNSLGASGLICAWYRVYVDLDAAPTLDFANDAANDTNLGQIAAWRGCDQADPIDVTGTVFSASGSQDIGPIAGITIGAGDAVVVLGAKRDDWTSVADLSGDSLTWAEIGEPDSQLGSDAGIVWDYAIDGGAGTAVSDKTFAVTGGTTALVRGVMFSLNTGAAVPAGTLTNPAFSSNGRQMTVDVSGGTWSTPVVTASKFTITGTSEGYNSELTLGTKPRSITVLSATYSGGVFTFDLSEPIHNDDTGWTITAEAGAVTSGGDSTVALGTPVDITNNSTLDYPIPTCHIISRVLDRVTGVFTVDVMAVGYCYDGYMSNFGIAAVTVTGTENAGGAGDAVVKTATGMTVIDKEGDYGDYDQYQAYRCTFDLSTDWGGDATRALASFIATAYPSIGDAGALGTSPTVYKYLNVANDYDSKTAWVNSAGTMTLDVGLSGTAADGALITGGTSGATACLNGSHASGTKNLIVNYRTGTFTSGEAITVYDSITGTLSGSPTWSADDATGAVGSILTPFRTTQKAGRACRNASAEVTGSFSTLYLMGTNAHHFLGLYTTGDQINTKDGPIILDAAAGATPRLSGACSSDGLRTQAIQVNPGVRIFSRPGAGNVIFTASPIPSTGVLSTNPHFIGYNNEWYADSAAAGWPSTSWIDADFDGFTFLYGGYFHDSFLGTARGGTGIHRDLTLIDLGSDIFLMDVEPHAIINCKASVDGTVSSDHNDMYQSNTNVSTTRNITNTLFAYNRMYDSNAVQPAPFSNNAGTESWNRVAFIFNIQEDTGASQLNGAIDDVVVNSLYMYHNSYDIGLRLREDDDKFRWNMACVKRNLFAALTETGTPQTNGTGFAQNHNTSSSFTKGVAWTTGGSVSTLNVDWANEDYSPVSEGDLDLGGSESELICPTDAAGTAWGRGWVGALGGDEGDPVVPEPAVQAASSLTLYGNRGIRLTGGLLIDILAGSGTAQNRPTGSTFFNSGTGTAGNSGGSFAYKFIFYWNGLGAYGLFNSGTTRGHGVALLNGTAIFAMANGASDPTRYAAACVCPAGYHTLFVTHESNIGATQMFVDGVDYYSASTAAGVATLALTGSDTGGNGNVTVGGHGEGDSVINAVADSYPAVTGAAALWDGTTVSNGFVGFLAYVSVWREGVQILEMRLEETTGTPDDAVDLNTPQWRTSDGLTTGNPPGGVWTTFGRHTRTGTHARSGRARSMR